MGELLFRLDKIVIIGGIAWGLLWFIPFKGKKGLPIRLVKYFGFMFLWFHLIGKDLFFSPTDIFWVILGTIGVLLFILIDAICPFRGEPLTINNKLFEFEDQDVENDTFRNQAFDILKNLENPSEKERVAKYVQRAIRGDFWIWNFLIRISMIVVATLGVKFLGWVPYVYLPIIIILWHLDWYISDTLPNLTWIDLYRRNPQLFRNMGVTASLNNLGRTAGWAISEWFCLVSTLVFASLAVEGIPYELIQWTGIIFIIAQIPYYLSVILGRRASLPMKVASTKSFYFIAPALVLVLLLGKKGFYLAFAWAIIYFFIFITEKEYSHLRIGNFVKVVGILFLVTSVIEAYPRLMAMRFLRQAEQSAVVGNFNEAKRLLINSQESVDSYFYFTEKLHLPDILKLVPINQEQKITLLNTKLAIVNGNYSQASEYLQKIEKISTLPVSKVEQLRMALIKAQLYHAIGDESKKEGMIIKASNLAGRAINSIYWTAYANCYRASLKVGQENYDEAIRILKDVKKVGKKLGSYKLIVSAVSGLGDAYFKQGKYSEAEKCYSEVLKLSKKLKAKGDEAVYFLKLAKTHKKMGHLALASKNLSQAINLARKISSHEVLWQGLYQKGLLLESQAKQKEALKSYADAISVIEQVRGRLSKEEYRLGYMANKMDVYEHAVLLAYKTKKKSDAFTYVQKAKSRVFLDLLGTRMVAYRDEDKKLAEKEHLLQVKINALLERVGEEESKPKRLQSGKLKGWKEELQKALKEHADVLAEIKRTNPRLASLTTVHTVEVSDIQKVLYPDEVFLEYFITDDKTFLWAITKTNVRTFEIPLGRKKLYKLVSNIYQPISLNVTPSVSELNKAYRRILAPAMRYFGNKTHIIIAPHDRLYFLPFETFLVETGTPTYVVDRWFVSYYPSGSILVLNRKYQEKRPSPKKPLFAVGDPVFSPNDPRYPEEKKMIQLAMADEKRGVLYRRVWMGELFSAVSEKPKETVIFPRLENTGKEVRAIGSLWGVSEETGDIKVGINATEKEVKRTDHTKYKYEHYATHGVLRGDVRGLKEPALVFSLPNPEDPPSDEGFLTMSEIFRIRTNADMVVLSACKTALGEEVPGEGLVGLTRAFMYAGTPSVVASLWSVADESTAKLMIAFHRYLKQGKDKAQALTLAKRALRRQGYYNPFYWAPFILMGER